ncbi:hypothetical protein HPB50_005808 [Hyalomma asiaticum]|uniref:Uncharacterized protein n=1 Tax=Hyalomma asiaticum TaxID=266040 RepID=A0ACB7TFI7_HYAAI|nr:hypothetical protein HPB50_005808 [Hyalomma asiaticum]
MVHADSTPVPVVSHLRVLGLILQSNRSNTDTIDQLSLSVQETARILARVRARREVMDKRDLLRLIDAFVISRRTYRLPYTNLLKSERDKIDVLIHRAYNTALGLPPNSSTERLLRLGVHNTIDEYDQKYTWNVRSSGRTSVTVWGVVTYQGLGPLRRVRGRMTAAAYMDVIETVLLPYILDGPFPDGLYHFQQDGTSIHTARKVRELLDSLGIIILYWPARISDINIIQIVWSLTKRTLAKQRGLATCSVDDLWCAVESEWARLRNDSTLVDQLYKSVPQGVQSYRCLVELQRAISWCLRNHLQSQRINYDEDSAAAKSPLPQT